MVTTLKNLKLGKRVDVPVYDFTTHRRAKYSVSSFLLPTFFHFSYAIPLSFPPSSLSPPLPLSPYQRTMYGANVILFEGILSLVNRELRELMDLRIFVDTDSDIRLARRLKRDIAERGRDLVGVLKQYNTYVKPVSDFFRDLS